MYNNLRFILTIKSYFEFIWFRTEQVFSLLQIFISVLTTLLFSGYLNVAALLLTVVSFCTFYVCILSYVYTKQ